MITFVKCCWQDQENLIANTVPVKKNKGNCLFLIVWAIYAYNLGRSFRCL